MSSLCPYIFNDLLHEMQRPTLFDQHFATGIPANELAFPSWFGYYRPFRHLVPKDSGISSLVNDKDGFKVNLDVQQFKPEELSVKVVNDYVVVEGKHEERSDEHGFISRQFTRRYLLPKDVDAQALESNISSDGVLQLHAPKVALENANERTIPITHSNKPALKQQESAVHQTHPQVKEDKKGKKPPAK